MHDMMPEIESERRGLPHNHEAECVVLGAMMLESNNVSDVLDVTSVEDFYRPAHQMIFRAIVTLFEANQEIDTLLVSEQLAKQDELHQIGGLEYLDRLTHGIPRLANVRYYAGIVHEKALLRKLIHVGSELRDKALEPQSTAADLMADAESTIFELREGKDESGFKRFDDLLIESYKGFEERAAQEGELVGLKTGFIDYDRMTSGLQKGDLIIVAARPAMGKTSFVLNVALNVALKNENAGVAIFSLEMPASQLTMRLIGSEARVGISALRSGRLQDDDWNRIGAAVANLGQAKLYIEDSGDITVAQMRAALKRLKMKEPLDLIVIDYLQLMSGSSIQAAQGRVNEVSAISRGLKMMAKDLDCPVIALSQLSRAAEQRADHRPQLADLRESGSIEQDADMVAFLFREDYYKEKSNDVNEETDDEEFGIAELIIAKHRNGPTGKIDLAFFKKYTRFENYSDEMEFAP